MPRPPSWPPPAAFTPGARTHNGLLSLGEEEEDQRQKEKDIRLCALARIIIPQAKHCTEQPPPPPPVLCCQWQNLFSCPSHEQHSVFVAETPLYFVEQQPQLEGPPFELYRGDALEGVWSASPPLSPLGADRRIVPSPPTQGCLWGVVINPAWADPADAPATAYDIEPPLRWPAELCVCSDLCLPHQMPRFAFQPLPTAAATQQQL